MYRTDIRIGNISNAWYSYNRTSQICMVHNGYGPDCMTEISPDNALVDSGRNVLILNGRFPCILAATDGTSKEPIYLGIADRPGNVYSSIEVRFIPGTNIIHGLSTNDKCEVCWKGAPLKSNDGTFIKVRSIANARICTL